MRDGGHILADQLAIHGVRKVFTVPGESFLSLMDGIYEHRGQIELVTARLEAGAANMADAYAKLTGEPGVVLVNRGPGAAHASVGVHTAYQDSTPMIVLVGQGPSSFLGRESFQEMDHTVFFSELSKWAHQVESPDRLPEMIHKAFAIAQHGRPGPVVLALPENVLVGEAEVADMIPQPITVPSPSPDDVSAALSLLTDAARPLAVIGGGGWTRRTADLFQSFAESAALPVVASFRCQDYIDNDSSSYIGYSGLAVHPVVRRAFDESDLILAVGARLGEATTSGYELVSVEHQRQRLVHVHRSPEELGSVFHADVAINSGYEEFAEQLLTSGPVDGSTWREWSHSLRSAYVDGLEPVPAPGDLNLAAVARHLSDVLPRDGIVTNGAGNFTVWAHRYHRFHQFRTQLGPTSGAMGYGIPAAVAAKLAAPDKPVICWTGDGDALMSIHELAVAMHYDLNPVILLVNNGMLGTMRMHQERRYPGRVIASDLTNPDFGELAASFGALAIRVERTEDFPEALSRALESEVASVIELVLDPEQITPIATLSGTRRSAEERIGEHR